MKIVKKIRERIFEKNREKILGRKSAKEKKSEENPQKLF